MTPHQETVLSALPPGRFVTPTEAQRHTAKVARMVYSRQAVAIILGHLAGAGHIEREVIGGKDLIFRRQA